MPKKEGNYLIQHTIDGTLTGSVVLAVKFLKSDLASAAAGEKAQFGGETGWARNVQKLHSKIDSIVGDGGTVVGYANEVLTKGHIVRVTGSLATKSGLPGEELTPVFAKIAGEASSSFQSTVYIVEGPVTGSAGDTAVPSGSLFTARLYGLHGPLTGTVADGDFVWMREDGVISTTLATIDRKVGTVIGDQGAVYYINFDGTSDYRPDASGVTSLQGAYDGGSDIDTSGGSPLSVTGSAGVALKEITQAGTITTNLLLSNVNEVNLTGSALLANPTGMKSGFTYIWLIKQPMTATGSLTYDTAFVFPQDISGSLTVPSGSATVDILSTVCSGSTLFVVKQGAFAV